MKINLIKNGPMAVSFEVYNDFLHYKGGVYAHTGQFRGEERRNSTHLR